MATFKGVPVSFRPFMGTRLEWLDEMRDSMSDEEWGRWVDAVKAVQRLELDMALFDVLLSPKRYSVATVGRAHRHFRPKFRGIGPNDVTRDGWNVVG